MIETTPYANSLFEQPWWLDIVAPGEWAEVFVKENDDIIARFPYTIRKKRIQMPILTQTLGPWIKPEIREKVRGNSQLSIQKEIITQMINQLPRYNSFDVMFDSANEYILPYRWLGFRYEPSFSYRIKDLSDYQKIENNFHKSVKKNITRSSKICVIDNDPDPRILYSVMEKTFRNQKRKYPFDYEVIKRIVDRTSTINHGRMFIAKDTDGNVHACSYLIYDEKSAYALLGGADPEYRNSGAKSLVWEQEILFASKNSAFFDFEGSNIETIENFVRQFGGERVINYRVTKQPLWAELSDILKPRIKRIIGYKI